MPFKHNCYHEIQTQLNFKSKNIRMEHEISYNFAQITNCSFGSEVSSTISSFNMGFGICDEYF